MTAATAPQPSIRTVAVVLNAAAGALLQADDPAENLTSLFADSGLAPTFIPTDAGTLPQRIQAALRLAPDAIIVAGGDGTIACAAQVMAGSDTPLGILPFGTMNLLAKDLGIPTGSPEQAVRIIAAGLTRAIDAAEVNGHIFLCASMLGLPAQLGRVREARRRQESGIRLRLGIGLAFLRLLRTALPRRFVVQADETAMTIRSPAVTIAVNAVDEPDGRGFGRARLDGGELAVYVIRRLTLLHAVRLAFAWWFGTWRRDPILHAFRCRSLTLGGGRRAVHVMNDGEQLVLRPPLAYRIRPNALRVLAPDPDA